MLTLASGHCENHSILICQIRTFLWIFYPGWLWTSKIRTFLQNFLLNFLLKLLSLKDIRIKFRIIRKIRYWFSIFTSNGLHRDHRQRWSSNFIIIFRFSNTQRLRIRKRRLRLLKLSQLEHFCTLHLWR